MGRWLQRNWRKVVLIILGAAAGIAGDRTIVREVAPVVSEVVRAMPCTPGEADCPAANAYPVK